MIKASNWNLATTLEALNQMRRLNVQYSLRQQVRYLSHVALRKKYGKNLILIGNIDKWELLKGKDAIRKEVLSKVPFLLDTGGYFPSVDHHVPSDVTLENYRYFINTSGKLQDLKS